MFLLKKPTKPIFLNSEPKPVQTDHFRAGSVRLIEEKFEKTDTIRGKC
jgi:hypothetical protein